MSDCSFHCLYIYIIAIVHDDVLTWFWLRSMLTYPNTGREERKNDNANHLGPFALSLMSQNLCVINFYVDTLVFTKHTNKAWIRQPHVIKKLVKNSNKLARLTI